MVVLSLNPSEKVCLWDLLISTNVSVTICQLLIRQFALFEKFVLVTSHIDL